jgi:hypothetical protein
MVGKRKSQPESPAASAVEESDSGSPARKKQRNGHANGHTNGDAEDEDMEESIEVKPEGVNGSQATNGHEENGDDNSDDEEAEKDYIEERNEEGEIIRRPKRRIVKIERGADGYVSPLHEPWSRLTR